MLAVDVSREWFRLAMLKSTRRFTLLTFVTIFVSWYISLSLELMVCYVQHQVQIELIPSLCVNGMPLVLCHRRYHSARHSGPDIKCLVALLALLLVLHHKSPFVSMQYASPDYAVPQSTVA
jgi:uncharacterized membrane protein YhaH (DUF805 family)